MTARNVILLTVDSVRADFCSFLSEGKETTPTLNRIAEESLVFENAIAPGPQTLSSVPAVQTGEAFPVTDHSTTTYDDRIGRVRQHIERNQTIGEMFQNQGYTTACIEANPWTSQVSGIDKGYDVFHDVGGDQRKHISQRFEGTQVGPLVRMVKTWYHKDKWFSQWPDFYDRMQSTISDLPEPYFVWIFLLDTHNPYFVGKEDRVESSAPGMYYALARANSVIGGNNGTTNYNETLPQHVSARVKRAYRDSIRSVDRFVGTILEETAEDDPILAVYSDHGEGFGDHGEYGHQHTLYEENIHVPCLIYNSGVKGRVREPFSLLQLKQLLQDIKDGHQIEVDDYTAEYVISRTEDSSAIAVRGEGWKYITTNDGELLFDLTRDPSERRDVSSLYEETVEELRTIKEEYMNSLPVESVDPGSEPTEEIHDRLDALGYVG